MIIDFVVPHLDGVETNGARILRAALAASSARGWGVVLGESLARSRACAHKGFSSGESHLRLQAV